jgi:hypothetical protein
MARGNGGVLNLRAQVKQFNHPKSCPINPSPPRLRPPMSRPSKPPSPPSSKSFISLTDAERKSLPKAGPNSLSFVEHAQTAADNNPTILPGSFNAANFDSHVDLFSVLTDINTSIAQLASSVDDTRMAVGSEAMNEARQVYDYVKSAAKNTPGLKPVADQLGKRFQHTSAAKPASAPAK